MLSPEQIEIIDDQIARDNAAEFVHHLIISYCTSTDRMSELLQLIPKIAEKGIQERQNRINEYYLATELLIGERSIYPISKRKPKHKKSYVPDFSIMLYVSKAYFPNGNCEKGSQADKEFFHEFIEMLKIKNGFDYTDKKDWEWAISIANCKDWLLSIIHQNIDSEFDLDSII